MFILGVPIEWRAYHMREDDGWSSTRKQATVRGAYDDGVWPLVYVSGYDTAPFCSTIGAVVSSPVR